MPSNMRCAVCGRELYDESRKYCSKTCENSRWNVVNKIFGFTLLSCLLIVVFYVLLEPSKFFKITKLVETPKESQAKFKPKPNWEYNVVMDKMDGTKRQLAWSISTNDMQFKFPYEGTYFKLLLRKDDGKKTEIILQSSGIPFMPSYDYSEKCRVKFDKEQPVNYSYTGSKESMNSIFFSKTQQFVQKLKTANKLMIECSFYEAGGKVMEFNVNGLEWE